MSAFIYISEINPLRFHRAGATHPEGFWRNVKPAFEYDAGYCQPYQVGDRLYLQFRGSNKLFANNIKLSLLNNNGNVIVQWSPTTTLLIFGLRCFIFDKELPNFPEGVYILRLNVYNPAEDPVINTDYFSEPIYIAPKIADSVAITYWHINNDYDWAFVDRSIELPAPMIRVVAGVRSDGITPGGKYDIYTDMEYRQQLLTADPYTVEKWTFGDAYGIPPYLAVKLNLIFSLSDVMIDGVKYTRNEGAKFERIGLDDYPLAGYALELVKSDNPFSYISEAGAVDDITVDIITITVDNEFVTSDIQ